MSSPGNEMDRAAVREWAAETLDVPVDTAPEVATLQFLRLLTDDDFVPMDTGPLALAVLTGTGVAESSSRLLRSHVEGRLHEDCDRFATTFFELDTEERNVRLDSLWGRSESFPAQRRRLSALKDALNVDLPAVTDVVQPESADILKLAKASVVKTPPEAARERQRVLARIRREPIEWKLGNAEVRRRYPQFALLTPHALSWIAKAIEGHTHNQRKTVPSDQQPSLRVSPEAKQETNNRPLALFVVFVFAAGLLVAFLGVEENKEFEKRMISNGTGMDLETILADATERARAAKQKEQLHPFLGTLDEDRPADALNPENVPLTAEELATEILLPKTIRRIPPTDSATP